MIAAADAAAHMVQGLDAQAYSASLEKRSAVERQLMIVGEAAAQLRGSDRELFARLTNADRIVAFRNILVHGYHMIQHDVVWDIITSHLPVLRVQAREMLDAFDP